MGWEEQRKRAKQFHQETDDALDRDILHDNLFSNTPVKTSHHYECVLESPNSPLDCGDSVRLIDMKDRIDIYVGTRAVGRIEPSQTEMARQRLRLDERKGRSVQAKVTAVSGLAPGFTVRIGE